MSAISICYNRVQFLCISKIYNKISEIYIFINK